VVHEVEDRPHQRQRREQGQAEDHVADLADDVERQDPRMSFMRRGAENARHHRHRPRPREGPVGKATSVVKISVNTRISA
jgi:hypothetical protein